MICCLFGTKLLSEQLLVYFGPSGTNCSVIWIKIHQFLYQKIILNKTNLRDLIAATGLVILLKSDSNHQFFSPCALEVWWMILENKMAPLLYYVELCASFQIHRWTQTGSTVRNTQFGSKLAISFPVWPWNLTDDLEKQQGTSSMLLQALCIISKPSVNSKWSYSPEKPNSGQNRQFFLPCDLKIWRMTLKNNFAWTSLLSLVITPENFMKIRWWEHSETGVTDGQTDGRTDRQTDWSVLRAAWSKLKITLCISYGILYLACPLPLTWQLII